MQAVACLPQRRFSQTPSERMVEKGGISSQRDMSPIRSESQLQAVARAGATDFLAAIVPVGADATGSRARTWALLQSLHETALTFEPSPVGLAAVTPRSAGLRRVHTGSRRA